MLKIRDIFNKIVEKTEKKEFLIITGARQTGKTTVLRQIQDWLEKNKKQVWYITLEREDVLREINLSPENVFQYAFRPKLESNNPTRIYLLIDEIQYAENPSNFIKYLYDTYAPHLQIIATGSSSFYIDKKFTDSLAGRKRIFNLTTLNFNEFLDFKGENNLQKELSFLRSNTEYKSLRFTELQELFSEYLIYGGYPDVVLSSSQKDKLDKLYELKNSFLKRDILESKVENEQLFHNLFQLLASQTGDLVNKSTLSKTLRCDLSTIDRYLTILQKCFHISLVKPFHRNIKKEIVKMPKVYFSDLGMRNLLTNNFSNINQRQDHGTILENYVFNRFKELYYEDSIHFWRTANQNEVDFVIDDPLAGKMAYEVKFSTDNARLSKYKIFKEAYPEYPLQFLGFDYSAFPNSLPVIKL